MKNSKKIALGTLMACLITGTAFAADVHQKYDGTVGDNVSLDFTDAAFDEVTFAGEANHFIGASNKGTAEIKNIKNIVANGEFEGGVFYAHSGGTLNVNEGIDNITVKLDNPDSNVIHSMGGTINIKANEKIDISNALYGVYAQVQDGGTGSSEVKLEAKDISIVTTGNAVKATDYGKGENGVDSAKVSIKATNDITIESGDIAVAARSAKYTGQNYAANAGTAGIEIIAGNELNITGKTGIAALNGVEGDAASVTASGKIVNITGTETAIDAGDNAKVVVGGGEGFEKANITGDIKATADDEKTSNVEANLGNAGSFTGAITTGENANTTLGLGSGSTWNLTGDSTVSTITGEGTVAVTEETMGNKVTVGNAGDAVITVSGDKGVADAIAANEKKLQDLANVVSTGSGEDAKSAASTITTEEGTIVGSITAEVNDKGEVVNVVKDVNTSNAGISDMASLALVAWRAENNDMNKRLGELRDSNGEHGVWVRMMRGESEYSSVKNQYNTYQLGYDEKLSTDPSWTVGVAVSYTEGDSSFDKGGGENKHRGISLYGSKLNEDGSFIDLIAKYAQLDHEYTVAGGVGDCDYDANGYSVSAEYGKRFTQDNGFWFEPQVELTYGTVGSANYTAETGALVQQDDMESLVGRIGFRMGKDIKQGNIYARASYLYDFDGETSVTMSKATAGSETYEQDLGGGWFEVGVGTNISLSKATYLYADVERTFGGEVDTPWQYNVGVRYSF